MRISVSGKDERTEHIKASASAQLQQDDRNFVAHKKRKRKWQSGKATVPSICPAESPLWRRFAHPMLLQNASLWKSGSNWFSPCVRSLAPRRNSVVMASADQPAPQPIQPVPGMKLLFVEMGTGYDQHG